jgi:PAS domain-containing protein
MTTPEFLLLVTAIGAVLKSADWLGGVLKNFLDTRKANKHNQSHTQIELGKLEWLAKVDLSKINNDQFGFVAQNLRDLAADANRRAQIAEEERDEEKCRREQCETEFKVKLDTLDHQIKSLLDDHRSCHIVLDQVQRNLRFLYDTSNIAYWEVDKAGKCVINGVFYKITGLRADECGEDGWLAAVIESDRKRVAYQWRNFRDNFQTHCALDFRFEHIITKSITEVRVECNVVMMNGFEVSYYTARTNPLIINSAE